MLDLLGVPILVDTDRGCRRGKKHRKGLFSLVVLPGNFQPIISLHSVFIPQKQKKKPQLHT